MATGPVHMVLGHVWTTSGKLHVGLQGYLSQALGQKDFVLGVSFRDVYEMI